VCCCSWYGGCTFKTVVVFIVLVVVVIPVSIAVVDVTCALLDIVVGAAVVV